MVLISTPFPHLSPDLVSLYHTTDPLLSESPILVFHGHSTTANSSRNTSRIQVHVFTLAGFQSYPRITVSPNAPLYAAVKHLPREQQGDEVCRGLAIGLLKYFSDMPDIVKAAMTATCQSRRPKNAGPMPVMFDEMHAGNLASRMTKVTDPADLIRDLQAAFEVRSLSSVDVDVMLPHGSIQTMEVQDQIEDPGLEEDLSLNRYGRYASLIRMFGASTFVPTSKLRRAPSKASGLNRSKSLSKGQKEALRREMSEFVETETRYVSKLQSLVKDVASDFRAKAKLKGQEGSSPGEDALKRLFPCSLDDILDVNSRFADAIQAGLLETEPGADQDMNADLDAGSASSRGGLRAATKDATGSLAFSKLLLTWFPDFAACYSDYMRASANFSNVLAGFTKDVNSTFSQRVRQTGEQRLRSMLIEPVQRLPRYTLFIDNIVNLLPATHPALQPLLKARDIVTDICALDSAASSESSRVVGRLQSLITSWPQSLQPQGRITAAVDFVELDAPYRANTFAPARIAGVFLLFADCLVLAQNPGDSTLTARGIVAEVERPSAAAMAASLSAATDGRASANRLVFLESIPLTGVRFCESNSGVTVWMYRSQSGRDASPNDHLAAQGIAHVRAFNLVGPHEGKASRWLEDVARARIEGRFSEEEREGGKWELRSTTHSNPVLTVFAAVSEKQSQTTAGIRKAPSTVQVVIKDDLNALEDAAVGENGVEIVMSISKLDGDAYHLETQIVNGYAFADNVSALELPDAFFNRLGDSLFKQSLPQSPALVWSSLSLNQSILRSLNIVLEGEQPKSRAFRPPSPVKLISNLLNGGSMRESATPTKQARSVLENIPKITPLGRKSSRSKLQKNTMDGAQSSQVNSVSTKAPEPILDPLKLLEDTLATYLFALHARRGSVAGRLLRARSMADELTVNDVYNSLLEDPSKQSVAAEAPLDVLFSAFEKFLKSAWKEQMGWVVPLETMDAILAKSDTSFAPDFAVYFKMTLGEMAPQNRRAFKEILKLLADLLEGSGNDGDRGALTATFAELLDVKGDPHAYISLLDRLVEDFETLFEDSLPPSVSGHATPVTGSMNSLKRARSVNTGSLSSNASSIRKRFGFNTPSRENSRHESDAKAGSVWRNLSKSARGPTGESASASLSKASLMRAKSSDGDPRLTASQRPISHERPTVLGSFPFEGSPPRPGSSHLNLPLETIAASPPNDEKVTVSHRKKKRRSSLSDLRALQESSNTPATSSVVDSKFDSRHALNSSPRTPSPVKRPNISPHHLSLDRIENSPSMIPRGTLMERPHNVQSGEVIITEHRSIKTPGVASSIPTLRAGLRVKSRAGTPDSPKKDASSPPKLRIQSPQKLRERLQNEQKAIDAVDQGLQSELLKVGEELSQVKATHPAAPTLHTLTERVAGLEGRLPTLVADLTARTVSLATDVAAALQASETKVRSLDALYNEANAENEALYGRFNDELAKMLRSVKAGKAEEMLSARLDGTAAELRAARTENARLKRENTALRAALGSE